MIIQFSVTGTPRPKQSVKKGRNRKTNAVMYYTPAPMKEWQNAVAWKAKEVMQGLEPFESRMIVLLDFCLPDNRRKDLDNLSKGCLDGCNKIIWKDDQQIILLIIAKKIESSDECAEVGVDVYITDAIDTHRITEMLKDVLFKGV